MYRGDIRLGETVDFKFTTRNFSTGAPFTLAGSPVISAYVGNGTTEITAGITLTVDFDSRTGLNNVRVVATSGNGFATATNVELVITTGTVNSVSVVGEVIGSFSIENRSAVMPTTAGRTLDVSTGGEAGVDWANVGTPDSTVNLSATTVSLVNTATTVTNQLTAAAIATGVWQDATAGDFTVASSIGKALYIANIAPGASGGHLISGSNAGTTTFGALTCTGTFTISDGVIVTRSSANAAGVTITASGTGNGLWIIGGNGATGDGIRAVANSTNGHGLNLLGVGTGSGLTASGGATGHGLRLVGGGTSGHGLTVSTTAGNGFNINPTGGHGILTTGNGTSNHGIVATGGTAGTSDGIKAAAGSGGVDVRGNITGNLTGTVDVVTTVTTTTNLTNAPTVGDFTATMKTSIGTAVAASAVASVAGNVGGNVNGSVGSVAANGITASSIATGAIDADALAADALLAIANKVEAEIIDETDSEKVLTAITDKIASVNPDLSGLTLAAIASSVWGNGTRTLTAGTNINGSTFTAIPWSAAWDAEVQSECADALTAYGAATQTSVDTIDDLLDTEISAIISGVADLPTNAELATALGTADDAVLAQVGLVKAKTDLIPASPAAVGSAMTLTSGERDSIAAALLDLANAIDTLTPRQVLRVMAAILAGKVSGAGSGTETFVGMDDSTVRAVVTVDNDGNRTAVSRP